MNELFKLFGYELMSIAQANQLRRDLQQALDKIEAQNAHIGILMKDKDALNQLMKDHAAQTVELEECQVALARAKNHRKKTATKAPEQV